MAAVALRLSARVAVLPDDQHSRAMEILGVSNIPARMNGRKRSGLRSHPIILHPSSFILRCQLNALPLFKRLPRVLWLTLLTGASGLALPAHGDWLHYRGPSMNGVSSEKAPAAWPASLTPLWKANLGTGSSSMTVASGRVYSMGNADGRDSVFCLDAKTGKRIWVHEYPMALDSRMFEGGTAATPTLDGDRVYTVSHQGDLFCLDAATGAKRWYKHYQQDFKGRRPQWGYAGSPTVEGNLLLCDVGGEGASTVALDKLTGALVWKSGSDTAGYASPVVATISGKRTVVMFKGEALVGLDLGDGHELWRTEWKTEYDVNAATPLVEGDRIFVTSSYEKGCALFEVSANKVTEVWKNKNLRAHINTPVLLGRHVYGIDGKTGPKPPLVCLDLASGNTKWSDTSVGGGSLVAVGNQLIALSERGELVVGEPSPTGFRVILRSKVLGGRCWAQPTYAGGKLWVRNNQGELVCFDLGK